MSGDSLLEYLHMECVSLLKETHPDNVMFNLSDLVFYFNLI